MKLFVTISLLIYLILCISNFLLEVCGDTICQLFNISNKSKVIKFNNITCHIVAWFTIIIVLIAYIV